MIKIYGASDDLVEIEGHEKGDEVGCYNSDVLITIGDTKSGGIAIRMSYRGWPGVDVGFGCWSASIVQLDESVAIPWPVSISHDKRQDGEIGYSVVVSVDAPPTVALAVRVLE